MITKEQYDTLIKELGGVTLIAVSKKQPIDKIMQLYSYGHRDFGENYVQELLEKDKALKAQGISDITWHFIGHLQKNKASKILKVCNHIHTVDSIRLAQKINQRAKQEITIFLEVNIDNEENKFGFRPDEIEEAYRLISILPNLSIMGLMCIPQRGNSSSYVRMQELRNKINPSLQLSMGMSGDYKEAIKYGATHVRIGTAIFGKREE